MKFSRRSDSEISSSVRETIATIAIQRRIRKSVTELEGLDHQSRLPTEYRRLNDKALGELRKIRERMALVLRRVDITELERKIATEYLHLIALVEPEFVAAAETAH